MRREYRYAELYQRRRGNRRSNDVVRRRRDTHAQDERSQHREEKHGEENAAREIDQGGGHLQTDTGFGDHADDNTCRRARREHGKHVARAVDQTLHNFNE